MPNTAVSKNHPVKIAGCYSDMRYSEESGDLLGYEFFIVFSRDGHYVLYQESEGEPDAPQLVPASIEGTTLRFTLPPDGQFHESPRQFQGRITNDGITGKFSSYDWEFTLKRKPSYWNRDNKYLTIVGCYSDLAYNEEGGDLLGFELFIVYARDKYYVLYQSSEGGPDVPLLLPVDATEDFSIRFMLPPGNPRHGLFTGVITKSGLMGKFLINGEHVTLQRKASYWQ